MAGLSPDITQGWSEHECSVFKMNTTFTPPFYIRTLGGLYSGDDSSCFSEGEIYIILLRLKIKGVIATVDGSFPQSRQPTQLKIPVDYDGKFYIASDRNVSDHTSEGKTLTLRDIVSDFNLPQKVCVANPQFHGKNFLQNINKSDCTLNLTRQKTEDYFLGKSPDGKLAFLFSTESNMNFYVKKTVNSDVVKSLQFNVGNLKYDIFVGNADTPIVQCRETVEVVYASGPPIPRRPPKVSTLSTTQSSRSLPPPLPQSGKTQTSTLPYPNQQVVSKASTSNSLIDSNLQSSYISPSSKDKFSYEVTMVTRPKLPAYKPPLSTKPPPERWNQGGDHSKSSATPRPTNMSKPIGESKSIPDPSHFGIKSGPSVSPKPPRSRKIWETEDRHVAATSPSSIAHSKTSEEGKSNPSLSCSVIKAGPPVSPKRSQRSNWNTGGSHSTLLPSPNTTALSKSSQEGKPALQFLGMKSGPSVPPSVNIVSPKLPRSSTRCEMEDGHSTTDTYPISKPNSSASSSLEHRDSVHSLSESRRFEGGHSGTNEDTTYPMSFQQDIGGKDGQNIAVPVPQLPIPTLPLSKDRHSGQAPLPLSKGRHPGQAHFDDKRKTNNVTETKPPPPLPPRADDDEDEAYNMQLGEGDCQNVDTDDEYDRKVPEREPTSPRHRSPPALPPIGMHVRPARSPQKNDDYYLTPVTSTISPKSPGFADDDQSSDSENLSDYEQIDSDNQSDYELVSEPTDTLSRSLPNVPAQAPSSPSGKLKKKFDFKKKFDKLKINVKKPSSKKKSQESGDIADDELTEDPYADQHFEKRPVKKRPQRRRDDPLPMPLEAGPAFQPPPIPTASPGPSFKAPSLPPSHSGKRYTESESDDSNKSDYEQVDDDDVNSSLATSHLGMRSYAPHRNLPTSSTHLFPTSKLPPSLRSPTSNYPAPPTTPPSFTGHRATTPSKIGVVKPILPQPHAQLNVSEEFPTDLCNLSVEAIAQTLRKLNIPDNVIENFREAQIDGQIFVCLDENILDDLGVGSLYKLKIIKFKNGWRPKAN